jgi:hypothetical protein
MYLFWLQIQNNHEAYFHKNATTLHNLFPSLYFSLFQLSLRAGQTEPPKRKGAWVRTSHPISCENPSLKFNNWWFELLKYFTTVCLPGLAKIAQNP